MAKKESLWGEKREKNLQLLQIWISSEECVVNEEKVVFN